MPGFIRKLIKHPSYRRKPVSRNAIELDSGLRRDDGVPASPSNLGEPVSRWGAFVRRFRRALRPANPAEERSTLARWLDFGEMPGCRPEAGNRSLVLGEPTVESPRAASAGATPPPRREADGTRVRLPVLSAAVVAMATWLWFTFGAAPEALVFDRAAVAGGEWWRLATGHWVHSDASHAALNIAALALIAPLVETAGRRFLLAALIAGTLAVTAGVVWGLPEIARYCGLSGVLNTLFVAALGVMWRRHRHPILIAIGGGLLVKLALELASGASLVVATEWPSVPAAHLAGVLGGVLLLGLVSLGRYAAPSTPRVPPSPLAPRQSGRRLASDLC
jgi:rhomboid family GlyGly-CTERM serine protease